MTSSLLKTNDPGAGLALRLPETAFTRSGIAFRPNEDVWDWTDGPFRVHLDFLKVNVPATFPLDSLKHALLIFAKRNSACYLTNLFQAFVHFVAHRVDPKPLTSLTVAAVSNYAASLNDHEKWRISTLNVLLQKWVALGVNGVESDCAQYLRERRKPGNLKGAAVRTRDPVVGPFSEAEYTALYKAVDVAYGIGETPLWVSILTRLLFACGGRISQYASLKIKDLVVGNGEFVLRLPQVKNREVHSRVSFQNFDLSPQTGRQMQHYIEVLKSLRHDEDSPMFPDDVVMTFGPEVVRHRKDDLFFGHCTSPALSRVICKALETLAPPTERLNFEPIPVSTRRFRYTFGTRLAEEGASKAAIADQLGHVDLQNVDVYFEASPKIVENIDKAMDAHLAPLAHAFRGHLVEDEEHSTHKGAPGSRIIDFRVAKEPVGSCGAKGQGCSFNKPIACYTCFKFEPWLDAPHEKVLFRLRAERERCVSDGRLAAINDDAIRAVQEVMAECNQAREQRIGAAA